MTNGKRTYCARCGVLRLPGRKTSLICADCRYVLSPQERELWEPEKKKNEAA